MLRRINAVPDRYMINVNYSEHINNGSAFSELTGRNDFTLGSLRLDSLEVSRQTSQPAPRPSHKPSTADIALF